MWDWSWAWGPQDLEVPRESSEVHFFARVPLPPPDGSPSPPVKVVGPAGDKSVQKALATDDVASPLWDWLILLGEVERRWWRWMAQ